MQTARLRVMLIITLSELMSDVQVTQMKPDGKLEGLRKSLAEMSDEAKSPNLLRKCGLSDSALVTIPERLEENKWSWSEVKYLSDSLLLALDGACTIGKILAIFAPALSLRNSHNNYSINKHYALTLLGWECCSNQG